MTHFTGASYCVRIEQGNSLEKYKRRPTHTPHTVSPPRAAFFFITFSLAAVDGGRLCRRLKGVPSRHGIEVTECEDNA